MRIGKFIILMLAGSLVSVSTFGQIISQNPSPELPSPELPKPETQSVETIDRKERIGRSGTVIQIPRAGTLLFASFDTNGDYIINKAEVASGIKRAFRNADRDSSKKLSLVELEGWRVAALGSEHAAPSNFAFAPNFARTVSLETFTSVLTKLADKLDTDDQSVMDGKIAFSDLLKDYRPPRQRQNDNCIDAIRKERKRAEQQCRNTRR